MKKNLGEERLLLGVSKGQDSVYMQCGRCGCGRALVVVLCISPEGTDLRAERSCLHLFVSKRVLCSASAGGNVYVGASLGVIHDTTYTL